MCTDLFLNLNLRGDLFLDYFIHNYKSDLSISITVSYGDPALVR